MGCDRCGTNIELSPDPVSPSRLIGDYGTDEYGNILCKACIPIVREQGTQVDYE